MGRRIEITRRKFIRDAALFTLSVAGGELLVACAGPKRESEQPSDLFHTKRPSTTSPRPAIQLRAAQGTPPAKSSEPTPSNERPTVELFEGQIIPTPPRPPVELVEGQIISTRPKTESEKGKEAEAFARKSLIFYFPGTTFSDMEPYLRLGFCETIVLMGANVKNANQVTTLVSELKRNGLTIVCIDHEGGRVLRIKDGSPSALVMGKERSAKKYGRAHGQLLASLGIDTNLAPVADILDPVNGNEVIGDRSFGSDPRLVAEMVAAYVEGLSESGVNAVLKHWPGHGSVRQDTHKELGVLNKMWEQIQARENLPFIAGIQAGADNIMVGHIAVPSVDDTTPTSRSRKLIDLLRETVRQQTGKEITLFSDSITMAVGTDPIQATKAMLGAGLNRITYIGQAKQEVYEAAVQHFLGM